MAPDRVQCRNDTVLSGASTQIQAVYLSPWINTELGSIVTEEQNVYELDRNVHPRFNI